ncbi:MAG TPA: hypothetical protein V6D19_16410 [Stenomitos sp.]
MDTLKRLAPPRHHLGSDVHIGSRMVRQSVDQIPRQRTLVGAVVELGFLLTTESGGVDVVFVILFGMRCG